MTFQVQAAGFSDLFEKAAEALLAFLTDADQVGETLREKIVVEAPDAEALLRVWIDALLNLAQNQHLFVRRTDVRSASGLTRDSKELRADAWGELIDLHRHPLRRSGARYRCRSAALSGSEKALRAEISLETV